jgi:hypothetical protein
MNLKQYLEKIPYELKATFLNVRTINHRLPIEIGNIVL